jgi:hypothetical protein
MISRRAYTFSARSLLAAALVWLLGVTVCSTRAVEMEAAGPHDHATTDGHDHHGDGAGHPDHAKTDDCACASFNAFPTQLSTLAKAPVPCIALLYTVVLEEITFDSVGTSVEVRNTGPPERVALSARVRERCQLFHAPPIVG